jgi:hypothetical protein
MRTILHLCADIGSDSRPYSLDPDYEVIKIGRDIGVENYHPDRPIHGIIANPVCTEFSTLRRHPKLRESRPEDGMELVRQCQRVISEAKPAWWAIENPATGSLRDYLGSPHLTYQPWQFGSPWTKHTALWGNFAAPRPTFSKWEDVPKLGLYMRPGRGKPNLAFLHKSSLYLIPEFWWAVDLIRTDADLRSMCSQGFAAAFKEANT